jgi:hypothetical protein
MSLADGAQCWAGRRAFASGRWDHMLPCLRYGRHVIAFSLELGGDALPGTPEIRLCDEHYAEIEAMGLIEEPVIDDDEWQRRTGRPNHRAR